MKITKFVYLSSAFLAKPGCKPLIAAAICLVASSGLQAAADGPDHFRIQGLAASKPIELLAEPRAGAAPVASVPANAQCLRNLGCQGGLSLQESTTLGEKEREKKSKDNPRWCKVEYQGKSGWVEGRHLAEGSCPSTQAAGPPSETIRFPRGATSTTVKGQLKGYDTIDYRLRAEAGQTLRVTLTTSNRQTYFNVNPPGTETAMFVGSTSGGRFEQVLPVEGEYTIRVYLMRAGARRGESSRYTLAIGVTGKPLPAKSATTDALLPGTPYHASATVPCSIYLAPKVSECRAFVIRREAEAAATVEIRWPLGSSEVLRRILMVQGKAIAADSPDPISQSRDGDRNTIRIGTDERFEFPDAFVTGG